MGIEGEINFSMLVSCGLVDLLALSLNHSIPIGCRVWRAIVVFCLSLLYLREEVYCGKCVVVVCYIGDKGAKLLLGGCSSLTTMIGNSYCITM